MNAMETASVISRLTGMITDLNNFGIDLRRDGASNGAVQQFLLGLRPEFCMLCLQLKSDRLNRLRAENIGNGVTRLMAELADGRPNDLDRQLTEIQTELLTLQMVLEDEGRAHAA